MVTGVPSEDCFKPARRLILRLRGIGQKIFQSMFHLFTIRYVKEISFTEKLLGVLPRRRHKRDPAGQRFKHSNGRDAGHRGAVLPARNMYRQPRGAIDPGRLQVRKIAGISHACLRQSFKAIWRVADAVDRKSSVPRKARCRLKQELPDLCGTFLVAPVSDPHHVVGSLPDSLRTKHRNIRCFVKSPHTSKAKALTVNRAKNLTKHQESIEAIQTEECNLLR